MKASVRLQADKVVFFTCLTASLALLIGGFLVPPQGEIHGSVLTGTSILLGFATLAIGAQAIQDGKIAKLTKGDMTISVGDDDDDENANPIINTEEE